MILTNYYNSIFITTDYENIAVVDMTFLEEIIDEIFQYERYIIMQEHSEMYIYVLQDIKEGLKVILTDHDWN